jgi:hypothetical protein
MTQSLVPQQLSHDLDFETAKDFSNPRSLINILPSAAANALQAIPKDLFEMSLGEVKKIAQKNLDDCEEFTLDLLKTAFWLEYNRAQRTSTAMRLFNISNGVMSPSRFAKVILNNSFRMLYIMTPPADYMTQQHHILNIAFENERKILSMPFMKAVYGKDGEVLGEEVDTKLIAIQQKISEVMRNRVMGMPVNRTMQVNQNFNSNSSAVPGMGGKAFEQMDESELRHFIEASKSEQGINNTGEARGKESREAIPVSAKRED